MVFSVVVLCTSLESNKMTNITSFVALLNIKKTFFRVKQFFNYNESYSLKYF